MGQQQSVPQCKSFSDEQISHLIQTMFNHQLQAFTISDVAKTISIFLQHLGSHIPIEKKSEGIVINRHMLKIMYHDQFAITVTKLINLLIEKLKEMKSQNILLIKRNEWGILAELVKFILIFTDQKLIDTVQLYTIRLSQLQPAMRITIEELEKQYGPFTAIEKRVVDNLSLPTAELLYTALSSTLIKLIQHRSQPISRSSQTFLVIQHVEQPIFMLFSKLIFTRQHYKNFIDKARNTIALKDFLFIGQYFIGSSCDLSLPSVFQISALMLLCIIEQNSKHLRLIEKDVRGLPSHIFPKLPVINKKTTYDFIAMVCLFSLVYTKQGTNSYQRFGFNRLLTLRLLNVIVRQMKVTSGQMTEYLQDLSLQTSIGMAERSFVTEIVKNYVKLIEEKIIKNKEEKQVRKSTSRIESAITEITAISSKVISRIKRISRYPREQNHFSTISQYTREFQPSQILTKYLQSGVQPYSIKYKGKRYTIPYIDVVDEIQKDDKQLQKQLRPLYEKFLYEFILYKRVIYDHNDRYVWGEILPKIIVERGLEGVQIEEMQPSERSELSNESRVNVMGYAPVVSLRLSQPGQLKNHLSQISMSKNKNQPIGQNLRCDTEQYVNPTSQTTEQIKTEDFRVQARIRQFQNSQTIRKSITMKKQTPIKIFDQSQVEKYIAQDSESQINLPQIDKKDSHYPQTEEFVVQEMQ